ncbi:MULTISPECIES: hypothetical protein [Listeria]|uniref:hypothetical protein n=1 Tax=Listeria TaxID=1637 RepID=UPI000B59605B|nr:MULTISPECIES: hypothetical protein [Listeria]
MAKEKVNLLHQIPVLKDKLQVTKEGDKAYLLVARNNPIEKIAVRFFKQKAFRKIQLDAEGEFILSRIDGQKNVFDLEAEFNETFGNEDEMSLSRLVRFLQIVESYGWLKWRKA